MAVKADRCILRAGLLVVSIETEPPVWVRLRLHARLFLPKKKTAETGIFHLQKVRNWCRLWLYTNLPGGSCEPKREMPVDLAKEIRVAGAFTNAITDEKSGGRFQS